MSELRPLPLVVAGVAFAAYPVLRPYADETTMAGLAAMASPRWVLAHLLGMTAFVLLAVAVGNATRWISAVAALTAVLLLPYYGAETFGLHAIGQQAVDTGDLSLLTVVDAVRYQPVAIATFGAGLLLLAVLGVLLLRHTWRVGSALRWAGVVVGTGLVLYLPQFFGSPTVRIAHGVVLGLACVGLGLLTRLPQPPQRTSIETIAAIPMTRMTTR